MELCSSIKRNCLLRPANTWRIATAFTERKKPATKEYIMYDSICKTLNKRNRIYSDRTDHWFFGGRVEGWKRELLTETGQRGNLKVMKIVYILIVMVVKSIYT